MLFWICWAVAGLLLMWLGFRISELEYDLNKAQRRIRVLEAQLRKVSMRKEMKDGN